MKMIHMTPHRLRALIAVAPKDDLYRPYLQGFHLEAHQDATRVTATDGHRVIRWDIHNTPFEGDPVTFAHPVKAPTAAIRSVSIDLESREIHYYNGKAEPKHTEILREIDSDRWPDVDRVIPEPRDYWTPTALAQRPMGMGVKPRYLADVATALGSPGVGLYGTEDAHAVIDVRLAPRDEHGTMAGETFDDIRYLVMPFWI